MSVILAAGACFSHTTLNFPITYDDCMAGFQVLPVDEIRNLPDDFADSGCHVYNAETISRSVWCRFQWLVLC